MPICVLVMGGPRAGTSLCAGILHRLGIHMGDDLGDGNEWNPLGFHEDGEFSDIYSRMCFGDGQGSMETYMPKTAKLGELAAWHAKAIASRCAQSWGVKSARLCYVLREFIEACPLPIKVIRMLRPESEMVASWQARSGVSQDAAEVTIRNAVDAATKAIAKCKPDLLEVQYHDLIDNPERDTKRIADFLGTMLTPGSLTFIRPELWRFRHG